MLSLKKFKSNVENLFRYSTSKLKERFIEIGNCNINYLKVGNGSHNVLLTPGIYGTIWTNYEKQILGLDSNKFSLVIFDPPGYGKSFPSQPQDRFLYERHADVGAELMKALNCDKYSLLGYSAGGSASLIHAAKYTDAVNKLVVWGASSFILPQEIETYIKTKNLNAWSDEIKEPMLREYGEENFQKLWSDWVDRMSVVFREDQDICAHMISNIKCPTLIMKGGRDVLVDKSQAPFLNSQIKNSIIYVYPDGKHHIHMQYAEDFNERVEKFLLDPTEKSSMQDKC